jgi:hypothetical protein
LEASIAMAFRIGPEISKSCELPGGSSFIAIVVPANVVHTTPAPLTATWLMDGWPDTRTSVGWPREATVRMSDPADQKIRPFETATQLSAAIVVDTVSVAPPPTGVALNPMVGCAQ